MVGVLQTELKPVAGWGLGPAFLFHLRLGQGVPRPHLTAGVIQSAKAVTEFG